MMNFRKIARDKRGATAIEYGLIEALIAVAGIASMTTVGTKVGRQFNTIGNKLNVT